MFDGQPSDERYEGRSADEVVAEVEPEGVQIRRWDADIPPPEGHQVAWTLDYRSDGRLNLWVERGKVVKACWF